MIETASGLPEVLKDPAPRVVFRKIGDANLDFELIVMIVDVSLSLKVTNDLNFAVFRALSDAGFIPIAGPPSSFVTVQGLDGMQTAMSEIATRFGQGGPRRDGTADAAKREAAE